MATKTIITTYLTGQTLYWFPLSRSLADWLTYRVLAVEADAPDLGKYSATLDSENADLVADPDSTFVLFVGDTQPTDFADGIQTTTVIASSAASGSKTILTTAAEGSVIFWYPLSRSLGDWETYRTIAVEASAPNAGRYSARLFASNADLVSDPYATFVMFSGSSQPASFNDGLQTVTLASEGSATSVSGADYTTLLSRIGHYLFGKRTDFSEDQELDIGDCLQDGLRRVYSAYDWSFLRPIVDVTTTAPYTEGTVTIASGVVTLTDGTFPGWAGDGILQVNNRHYAIASRDSNTQLTLNTTSVTVATASSYQLARPEIDLDPLFESIAPDGELTYYPSPDCWYPPVRWRHDATIRQMEASNPVIERPVFYSVRTARFNPTIGSRKVIAVYPTPDQVYTLRVPVILRPLQLDEVNLYAIGGEMLNQVILEACLASAEHNFEEREHVHEKRYQELIGLAIRDDQDRTTATSLGRDAPRGEYGKFGVVDSAYRLREQRIGGITLDGSSL